jgi:hypothetical protein
MARPSLFSRLNGRLPQSPSKRFGLILTGEIG